MRKGLDYLIWLINSKCLLLFKCEAGIIWITLDSSAWRYHFWFVKLLLHNWWQFMKCSNVAAFLGTTVKDLPKRWFFFCQKLMLLMLSNISKIYSLWSLFSLNIATIAAFPSSKFDLPEHGIVLLTQSRSPLLRLTQHRARIHQVPPTSIFCFCFCFYKKTLTLCRTEYYEPEFGGHFFSSFQNVIIYFKVI